MGSRILTTLGELGGAPFASGASIGWLLCATLAACAGGSQPADTSDAASGGSNSLATDDASSFHVEGPVGGPFPGAQRTVMIANDSPAAVEWRAEASLPWLLFSEGNGTLAAGQRGSVVVSLDPGVVANLPVGTYTADIYFRNARNLHDRVAIDFSLNVTETADGSGLLVTPEEDFETSGDLAGNIEDPTKNYRLNNVGREPFRYSVRTSEPWVTFSGGWHGTIDAGRSLVVTLGFDQDQVATLGAGLHTAWVEFANTTTGMGTERREVALTLRAGGRITEGLQALYSFDEGAGQVVHDESGVGAPLDLQIADLGNVQWLPGSLAVTAPTRITSSGPAAKISQACRASDEITVEAWIHPTNVTQEGPARIVSMSSALFQRNFSLAQGQHDNLPSEVFDVRLRTTDTDDNGIPGVTTAQGSAKEKLMHVAFTRRQAGVERVFIDGHVVKTADVTGEFSNWDLGYVLTLANEVGASRPWLGRYHLLAIYDRALSGDEVLQNFNEGTQDPGIGNLTVTPGGDYVIEGVAGGDFTPHSKIYTLKNSGTANLQ